MNNKPSDDDAFLQLPGDRQVPESAAEKPEKGGPNPAADLIRQKVEAAYVAEPDAKTEALDLIEEAPTIDLSRHQRFIYDLTNSGKSLDEIRTQVDELILLIQRVEGYKPAAAKEAWAGKPPVPQHGS